MLKKLTTLFFALFLTTTFALDKNTYYEKINEINQNKNYAQGIQALQKAIEEYPEEALFFVNLAYYYSYQKEFAPAFYLAQEAYEKFPVNKDVKICLLNTSLSLGWNYQQQGMNEKAFTYFQKAYELDPNQEWAINAYSYFLRETGKNQEAVNILEKAILTYPKNSYLTASLSWVYFNLGSQFLEEKNFKKSSEFLKKFFHTGDKKNIIIWTSYLYKLSHLKEFQTGFQLLNEAQKLFPGHPELYEPGYWLYFNKADAYFQQKDYSSLIEEYKKLYLYSKKSDKIWKNGITFSKLAMMNFNFRLSDIISSLCPYYKKFTEAQKKQAYQYLTLLKTNLPSELDFLYEQFKGYTLYRENKIDEAKKALDRSYSLFMETSWGKPYKGLEIEVDFPLKGICKVGNNESKDSVTHMGVQKYAYDIYGSDESGNYSIPGKDASLAENYYGYGLPIYSPVDGVIDNVEDGYPEDPIGPTASLPHGNNLQILSGGYLYHFYHLKQNSIKFKKGDKVKKGDIIALLGNSSSSIPHIHFGVYPTDWLVSLPIKFKNYSLIKNGKKFPMKNSRPGTDGKHDIIEIK